MKRRDFLKTGLAVGGAVLYGADASPARAKAGGKSGTNSTATTPRQAISTFRLEDVRLLPGPFLHAQETDRAYLLRLDPDRLLAYLRKNAGLTPKAAHYDGWDSNGSGMIGHYLSACAQMAQATGDAEIRRRVDYIVSEMAACQAAKGDGGLYGFAWDAEKYYPALASGKVIPVAVTAWYGTHKTLAGLRDAHALCGSAQARAVLVRMADWCVAVTAKLTDDQWQQMLAGEHGGPHEILADVSALTGDRKYLDCAMKFKHALVFDPLARGDRSVLTGLHANTQVPKFIGYERIAQVGGDGLWHAAAQNFWNEVVGERSWANGGNSQWEHFFDPADNVAKMKEICGPETCNTYNMLKLTRQLWMRQPSARYMDYYEHALLNHILPSQAPDRGGFNYYTPMRPGHYRVFSRDYDAFWCCVGTGMENHGKYGEIAYAHAGDSRLFVNLFMPSVLTWKQQGLTLRQETTFPEEPRTRIALTLAHPRHMTLSLRCPSWAAPDSVKVRVNGHAVPHEALPGSYVDVTREWKTGDRVEMDLPMRLHFEPLAHSAGGYGAFFHGPVLLAGALGTEGLAPDDFYGGGPFDGPGQTARKSVPLSRVPTLLADSPADAVRQLRPVPGQPLTFTSAGLTDGSAITLQPFSTVYFQRYALYWPIQTRAAYAQTQRDAARLEALTIDRVRIGEPDSEAAHHLTADRSGTGGAGEPFTHWRDAQGSFGYDLKVLPDALVALRCAYWGDDKGREFDITLDGTLIATEHLSGQRPGDYLFVVYPIPSTLTHGKDHVTVRFIPKPGNTAGGLFDLRLVQQDK